MPAKQGLDRQEKHQFDVSVTDNRPPEVLLAELKAKAARDHRRKKAKQQQQMLMLAGLGLAAAYLLMGKK